MDYSKIISLFKEDLKGGVEALYNAYAQTLYGYTIAYWNLSEDESYDVLYKTLETVGKVIDRYEFSSESHFRNWLFKIHKNHVLQYIRSKKSRELKLTVVRLDEWMSEGKELQDYFRIDEYQSIISAIDGVNPFEESTSANVLMNALNKALQQVSETEREILLLRMNNYSYDEIASMLGIENNQLKVKFNRAKAKVEKHTLDILKDTYHETGK